MGDFLAFRKMIAPYVIQVLFWTGAVGIVVAGFGAISQDQALVGFLILIFGLLYWRVACEIFIVFFRMNDTLRAIKVDTAPIPPALASRGWSGNGGTSTGEPALVGSPVETAAGAHASPGPAVAVTPPAGWYDDADRVGHTRWWDGMAWGIRDDEHSAATSGSPSTEAAAATTLADPLPEAAPRADVAAAVDPAAGASSTPDPTLEAQATRFCENCGAERSPTSRFCTTCGHA